MAKHSRQASPMAQALISESIVPAMLRPRNLCRNPDLIDYARNLG
jgi:hypothetical protein